MPSPTVAPEALVDRCRSLGALQLGWIGSSGRNATCTTAKPTPCAVIPLRAWRHCVEYLVDDLEAEVGFFAGLLGLRIHAQSPDFAMLTAPGGEFYLSISRAHPSRPATAPGSLRLEFMVAELPEVAGELERRGVVLDSKPAPCAPGAPLHIATLRTPCGIGISLWGEE